MKSEEVRFSKKISGGDEGIRTLDPLLAGQVLSQLSYTPVKRFVVRSPFFEILKKSLVGPSGLEPPTSCLSGTRSNLLSYDPMWLVWRSLFTLGFSIIGEQISLLSFDRVGIELSSHTVSRIVFSPLQSLTSVFGMGTGGPSAFVTPTSFSRILDP